MKYNTIDLILSHAPMLLLRQAVSYTVSNGPLAKIKVEVKTYRSQCQSEPPHNLKIETKDNDINESTDLFIVKIIQRVNWHVNTFSVPSKASVA